MSYVSNTQVNLYKHVGLAFVLAFLSALLFGLCTFLPTGLAVPLCIFFVLIGIGCLITAGCLLAQWFDQNF